MVITELCEPLSHGLMCVCVSWLFYWCLPECLKDTQITTQWLLKNIRVFQPGKTPSPPQLLCPSWVFHCLAFFSPLPQLLVWKRDFFITLTFFPSALFCPFSIWFIYDFLLLTYGFAQTGSWMDSAGTWTFWGFRDRKLKSGENLWSFSSQGGESSNNYVVRISFSHLLDTILGKILVTCAVWHKNQLGKKCHALKQALGGGRLDGELDLFSYCFFHIGKGYTQDTVRGPWWSFGA